MIAGPVRIRSVMAVLPLLLLVNCGHNASRYLEKGNALFDKGEFAAAALNYRNAIGKEPSNGEAYYRLGLSDLKQNKAAEAFQHLNEAVRLMPQNRAAKSELEKLALSSYLGDPQRPKVLYETLVNLSDQWLKQDPQSPEGLRIKGYLAMIDRKPDEAIDLLKRAHQSNPKEEKIALGLLEALFQSQKTAEAEKVGLEFISTEKAAADVYDALYRLYMASNRPAEAESILTRKIKENPAQHSYILQLAAHYARAGNKPEMAATLQQFLQEARTDPAAHLQAGDFYGGIGDWSSAVQQYNLGLAASGKDKQLYQNRIARALLLQNKRDEGLKMLNAAIAQNQNNEEAKTLRAALLLGADAQGKPSVGIQEFQGLVDKNPDDLSLKFVFAKAKMESGDFTGARAILQQIVKRLPNFLDAHVMLADIAFKQHNMVQAVEEAQAALEIDPANLRAQMLRGSALLRQGNLDEAGFVLSRLAQQVPQSLDVRLELAYVALNKRRYADAEADFKRILDSNPTEYRAIAGLVDTDLAQNRPERALSRLEEQLQRTRGAAPVRYMMASTALRVGRYNVAIENLRQLSDQTVNAIDPQLQLADVYRLKGDLHNAITTLQRAAFLKPKDTRPISSLPYVLEMANRKDEAKAIARRALLQRPDAPDAMNNLAFLLAETGDSLDEALKLARQAVSKEPNNPAFLDTLGYVYLKRDMNDDAVEIFNKLIRTYPDDPTCSYHLGMALYQKGDIARAKAQLSHALDRRPPGEIENSIHDILGHIN
jgi:tetratricopeptide (TPR) repeat protein